MCRSVLALGFIDNFVKKMEKVLTAKGKRKEVDMLHGPLLMKILMFALPLAASSVLQQLFNSVDVAVVGRFASSEALAAVGSNAPVISLLINLFIGVSMGANAVISNHIGQNNNDGIKKSISTVALVSVISGVFLLFLGLVVARPILTLMDTPAGVLDMAVDYLRIYFLGMPFFMIFNFGSAILRSVGDTKRPLYILIVAGIVNTILNLIFVIYFKMGVVGVAVATSVSNAVSAWLIIRILLKEQEPYRLSLKHIRIEWPELKRMLAIGVPAGVQGMVFSISNVIVQSTINGYGSDAVAGSAAALNFEFYCYFVVAAFNGAAISFIGQNYGSGKIDRVKRIFWLCMWMSVASCAFLNILFAWQGNFFLDFFSTEPEVHRFGLMRMYIVLTLQWIACSYEIAGSSLRGMGRSLSPTIYTIIGTCLLRIVWVFAVCPKWEGFDVLMMVYPISWTVTGVMVLCEYFTVVRRAEKKFAKADIHS